MLPNDYQYVPLPFSSLQLFHCTFQWLKTKNGFICNIRWRHIDLLNFFLFFEIKKVKTYITQMQRLYAFIASEPTHKKGKEEAGPNYL